MAHCFPPGGANLHEMLSASDPEEFASRKRKGFSPLRLARGGAGGWCKMASAAKPPWRATLRFVPILFRSETSVTAEITVGNEPTVIVDRDLV